jgi:hypothetical protein
MNVQMGGCLSLINTKKRKKIEILHFEITILLECARDCRNPPARHLNLALNTRRGEVVVVVVLLKWLYPKLGTRMIQAVIRYTQGTL